MLQEQAKNRQKFREQFIGTWKLVRFQRWLSAEELIDPWGTDIDGRLIYTADGHLSVQQMKRHRREFVSGKTYVHTVEEAENAFDGYVAYTGRFEINEGEGVIFHIVECSLFPNWVGQTLKRYYAFEGNRLTLRSHQMPEPDAVMLIWERLTQPG